MKQNILCLTCRAIVYPFVEPHSGEHLKYVDGRAMRPLKCDYCGTKIKPLDLCCAYSISTATAPYYEWEHEYIIFKKGE